jgi:hypothetical protein
MDVKLLLPKGAPPVAGRTDHVEVEDFLDRLFAAPLVDVGQAPMHHRAQLDSGALRLALAVLEDALLCAIRHHASAIREQREAAREALAWIDSEDGNLPFSFVALCQTFDLSPDWIRSLVRRRIAAEPARRKAA